MLKTTDAFTAIVVFEAMCVVVSSRREGYTRVESNVRDDGNMRYAVKIDMLTVL